MNYGFAFFPGQGAQAPGMGKDLYENSQAAKLVFEEASEGAGLDVAKLCFESDKATLSRTENSQIAIFTHSMAAWAALKEAGVEFKAAAGFSLGEYTALAAADVVSLADGVKIVSMRGKLMQQAALLLLGKHDFRNFSSAKKSKNTEREIYDIQIYGDTEEMQILIHADDFLHNMARFIVSILLDIGFGTRKREDIEDIFSGIQYPSDPCDPKGLYLQEITYGQ